LFLLWGGKGGSGRSAGKEKKEGLGGREDFIRSSGKKYLAPLRKESRQMRAQRGGEDVFRGGGGDSVSFLEGLLLRKGGKISQEVNRRE